MAKKTLSKLWSKNRNFGEIRINFTKYIYIIFLHTIVLN